MSNIDEREIIKRFEAISGLKPRPDVAARDIARVRQELSERNVGQGTGREGIWRIIMKSRITRLAAAAVIVVAAIIGLNMPNGAPAWAVEQTIQALGNVNTAVVTGEFNEGISHKFTLYIKGDPNGPSSFRGRIEAGQITGVIRDNMAYQHELGCREIYAYDLEKTKGKGVGTRLWYEVMKNAPWIAPIAPTMFQAAKLLSDDWSETYDKDEQTGRNTVVVIGSYEPLSASFRMEFDLKTKLIVRAKYWTNPNREGEPALNIENITYNIEVNDEIFDLEKKTGAKVVTEEETEKRLALWRQALKLEREKQYVKAIEAFQQIYEEYPNFTKTPEALCFIAILYRERGEYDRAIEFFEKVPAEYSAPRYAVLDAYRLLGRCYMSMGQDTKALEAFQTCLQLIGQWDPQALDWHKTRELVEEDMQKIQTKNK